MPASDVVYISSEQWSSFTVWTHEYHFSHLNAIIFTVVIDAFLPIFSGWYLAWTYSAYISSSRIFFGWFSVDRNSAANPDIRIRLGAFLLKGLHFSFAVMPQEASLVALKSITCLGNCSYPQQPIFLTTQDIDQIWGLRAQKREGTWLFHTGLTGRNQDTRLQHLELNRARL